VWKKGAAFAVVSSAASPTSYNVDYFDPSKQQHFITQIFNEGVEQVINADNAPVIRGRDW